MTTYDKIELRKIRPRAFFFFNFMVTIKKNHGRKFHSVSSIIKRDYEI